MRKKVVSWAMGKEKIWREIVKECEGERRKGCYEGKGG